MPFRSSKCIFLICVFFLFSFFVLGEETVLEVEQDSPDTKKAVQTAIQEVSVELMERFIEPSKLKARKRQIQKIISAYSNRYILHTQTAPFIKKGGKSFIIPVTIGFSEENLKKILLEEDLFYSGTSHLRILPLVFFEDLVKREHYGWWRKPQASIPDFMWKQISQIYSQLQGTLIPYGFFLINPELAGSRYFIPDNLLFRKPKKKNIFNLARFFKCSLVMTGSVKIRESDVNSILSLKLELAVYHVDSGRLLAEVERWEKIQVEEQKKNMPVTLFLSKNRGFAKSLGVQLKSIYEAGQISSNLLKIKVKGKLGYKASDRFQKLLSSKVKDIKNLQEHIIQSDAITYIANTNASASSVSKKIKNTTLPGFHVRVSRVGKNEIILKVGLLN